MGEMYNDCLQLFYKGKLIQQGDFGCGIISKPSPNDVERFAKVKTEMDAMAEKYKPIADKLVEEIYDSLQEPIESIIEEETHLISKVLEDMGKTMEKNFTMAFTNRKSRKHYTPKFTL